MIGGSTALPFDVVKKFQVVENDLTEDLLKMTWK